MQALVRVIRNRLLGPNWNVRDELVLARSIGTRLRADLAARLVAAMLVVSLVFWLGKPWPAIAFAAGVLINEVTELNILSVLHRARARHPSLLAMYIVHLSLGSILWAALGVMLWVSGGRDSFFLSAALLFGTLAHCSILYGESRLLTALTVLPQAVAVIFIILVTALAPQLDLQSKLFTVISIGTLVLYLLNAAFENLRNNERLRELMQDTQRLAMKDTLTGLKNRRAFLDEAMADLQDCEDYAVIFVDLDRFKPLNDEYGHTVGDRILMAVAERMMAFPGAISAARYGGDEFALIALRAAGGIDLGKRVRQLHSELTAPIEVGQALVSVGASVGWAEAPEHGQSMEALLHAADAAMLRAKSMGGGTARYDERLDAAVLFNAQIEQHIGRAIQDGQIRPALQPIKDTGTGRIVGHEMLARWVGSSFATDPGPQEFIPVAERAGLLNTLLFALIENLFAPAEGQRLAVNVSPSQLSSSLFLQRLAAALDRKGYSPRQVEIEITEEVAIRNLDENIAILEEARALGFRVVLDDFGSGYSSLSMLNRLPLDKIKIDRSLISTGRPDGQDWLLVRSVLGIAREMGLECCVEGVENADMAAALTEMGCDQLQGFWVGRPEMVGGTDGEMRRAS